MSQPPPGGSRPPGEQPDAGAPSGPPGSGGSDSTGHGSTGPIPSSSSEPPATSYQPGYQAGPPPGYQPGGPGGYQQGPPPGYQQGPPPGYGQQPAGPPPGYQPGPPPGYQQGPPPGYQQGPPPGYQQAPPPGAAPAGPPPGYQPGQPGPAQGFQQGPPPGYQQGGFPPPGAYGPPGQPGYPPQGAYPPAPGGPKPSFDMSKVTVSGWGVLGSSLLTLIVSFFPFWSVSAAGFITITISLNGWSLWWWLPVLLAVAVGVLYGLEVFGIIKPTQVRPEWLAYGAAASFVLMLGVMIQTFIYAGSLGVYDDVSHGPAFGVFVAVVTTAALAYFTALAAQSSGAKLPFKVPGPA